MLTEAEDDVSTEVAVGKPWEQLASHSGDLDLLVLGSRSFGPLRRLLLGSSSTKVVQHARCPLLIVPHGTQVSGDAAARPGTASAPTAR